VRRSLASLGAAAAFAGIACVPAVHDLASQSPVPTPSAQTPAPSPTPAPVGSVGALGGTVTHLEFAVTGDTRPATPDDTANYPSAIATKIFQDIDAESVPFAILTGDYLNASSSGLQASPQLDLYLAARASFHGVAFPVMGNHECNRHSDKANCGQGNADGLTPNYTAFVSKLLAPLGRTSPNYSVRIDAVDGSWTSKFVFVSGNSWSSDDTSWLEATLSSATTYTFVVRHQDVTATEAPGVAASAPVLAAHPYTLLLCAHQHTFSFDAANRQVITGNGGAPLTSSVNYGYTVVRQQADGTLLGTNFDYLSHATQGTFHVRADGSVVP